MNNSLSYRKRNRSSTWETACSESEGSIERTQRPSRRNTQTKRRAPATPQRAQAKAPLPPASPKAACPAAWQPESEESASIFDVIADESGEVRLLPLNGGESKALADMPEDEALMIRVFRFFEDKADEARIWEKELRNVNSGSLLWLIVHLMPKMHSVSGAKYGRWITAHHVRVLPRNLKSGYFMFEEGSSALAKSFGATAPVKSLVSGEKLKTGYFWFASPDKVGSDAAHKDVTDAECLEKFGWQHAGRHAMFKGDDLLAEWSKQGSAIEELSLQNVLRTLSPEAH